MSERMVKMARRLARKEAKKIEESIVPEWKKFVNTLNFGERLKISWKIFWGIL